VPHPLSSSSGTSGGPGGPASTSAMEAPAGEQKIACKLTFTWYRYMMLRYLLHPTGHGTPLATSKLQQCNHPTSQVTACKSNCSTMFQAVNLRQGPRQQLVILHCYAVIYMLRPASSKHIAPSLHTTSNVCVHYPLQVPSVALDLESDHICHRSRVRTTRLRPNMLPWQVSYAAKLKFCHMV
jgi:hypothetical protein